MNILKNGADWVTLSPNGGPWDPSKHDANGWPTQVYNGGVYTNVFLPGRFSRTTLNPGVYVGGWADGDTATSVSFNGNTYTGFAAGTSGQLTHRFTTTVTSTIPSQGGFYINNPGTSPATSYYLCHIDDEAAVLAANGALVSNGVFAPDAKSRLSIFKTIRFLDGPGLNGSGIVNWADRKPIGYYSWTAMNFPTAMVTTVTAIYNAGTATYNLALGGFALVDKAQVICRFDTSQTIGVPTKLNINSTGAKSMFDPSGFFDLSNNNGFNWPGNTLQANQYAYCVYDLKLDKWLVRYGPGGTAGIDSSLPPEVCVQLCNELGCNMWNPAPYLTVYPVSSNLPVSDWHFQYATYTKNNLNSGLVSYWEPPNELWNVSVPFFQTLYGRSIEAVIQGADNADYDNFYGRACSVIGKQIHDVFGGDTTRYRVMCMFQAGGGPPTGRSDRYLSTEYVSQGGAPATNWITDIGCATYFSSGYYNTPTEAALAYEYYNIATAPRQAAILSQYIAGCAFTYFSSAPPFTLLVIKNIMTPYQTLAASRGWNVRPYEGGYAPNFLGTWVSTVTAITPGASSVVAVGDLDYNNTISHPWDYLYNTLGASGLTVTLSCSALGFRGSSTGNTNAPGANTLFLVPFTSRGTTSISSVSCVPQATSPSANFKAVLYNDSAGAPNTLIATGAQVTGTSAGATLTSAFSADQTLTDSTQYWIGFITDTSVILAEYNTSTQGGKAANTYGSGPPTPAPGMTTGQPTWEIWANGSASLTATILSATPTTITINTNTQGLSGIAAAAVMVNSATFVQAMQFAAKFSPNVEQMTLQNCTDFVGLGSSCKEPSNLSFSGLIGNTTPFTMWDPDIYIATPPRILGIQDFNCSFVTTPSVPNPQHGNRGHIHFPGDWVMSR